MAQNWITGVSLRKNRLEWTVLHRVKDAWTVDRGGSERLEDGAALDGAFLKAHQRIFRGAVVLGLALDDALLRVAALPSTDAEELRGMAELQLEKFSPYPLDAMTYGAESLGPAGEGETLLAMSAVRLDLVEEIGAAFQEARVLPDGVDLSVLGWWRGLRDEGAVVAEGPSLAVRLLADGGEALLLWNGVPVRSFTLTAPPMAAEGEDAAAALADWAAEWTDQLAYELTASEAENGAASAAPVLLAAEPSVSAASEALAAEWRRLDGISDVTVASTEAYPSASEGLARRFADPAQPLPLNLAPSAWAETDREREFRRRLLRGCAAFVAVWLVALLVFLGMLHYRRAALEQAEAETRRLEQPAMAVRSLKATLTELQVYADRSASPLECLREVSMALPPGVSMNSYVYVKGEDLKIRGEAQEAQAVYDFVSALEASELFPIVRNDGVNTRGGKTAFSLTAFLPGSTNGAAATTGGTP